MKKIYSFLIALIVCAIAFGMVVYFNKPVVIAPETPEVSEPNLILSEEEINQLLEQYAYCEIDEDCTSFYAECPFGCGRGINKQYLDVAQTLINNFKQHQLENDGMVCIYWCVEIQGVTCQNYKCIVHTEFSDEEITTFEVNEEF